MFRYYNKNPEVLMVIPELLFPCGTKITQGFNKDNLAKLGYGLDESPTVKVGEKQQQNKNQLGKNRGILKPIWAFVETKKRQFVIYQTFRHLKQRVEELWAELETRISKNSNQVHDRTTKSVENDNDNQETRFPKIIHEKYH